MTTRLLFIIGRGILYWQAPLPLFISSRTGSKIFLHGRCLHRPCFAETETSGVTSLRIAFLNHPHFPECSKAMWQSPPSETETTFVTSLAETKQSQHWEIATKTPLMFFLNKKHLHPGFSRNDDAAFVHNCGGCLYSKK
jgi:quinolinate synthase